MRLLFDENLSRHLVRRLADVYPDSAHVVPLGLGHVADLEIFRFAAEHGLAVVTKDLDFAQLGMALGPPPKILWLRIGNCQVEAVEALLIQALPAVQEFEANPELAVLALPVRLLP